MSLRYRVQACRTLAFTAILILAFLSLTPAFLGLNNPIISSEINSAGSNYSGKEHIRIDYNDRETTAPAPGVACGFTLLDRVYMKNGTFFVVTADPSRIPPREYILSQPHNIVEGNGNAPTDKEIQFISPADAPALLGDHAIHIDGLSLIVSDTVQFFSHYYHLWGEIILGAWRLYSSLARTEELFTKLPFPSRLILPHIPPTKWRDPAGINGPLLYAAFPSFSVLPSDYWSDLVYLGETVVFERAIIINRQAAHKEWVFILFFSPVYTPILSLCTSPLFSVWFKMIAGTWNITAPAHFWDPIWRSTLLNALGYLPVLDSRGSVVSPPKASTNRPIVTYISRQKGSRRLADEDHGELVRSLRELDVEGLCELHVVEMQSMVLKQQLELAARTTVLVGVHGNGMTHQLWMTPSERSTVIEIFAPGSYNFDYEMLSRNMGHRHYGVWNDTLLTYPTGTYHEKVFFGDDFGGNSISVHGPSVAQVVRERLS